jgi:sulfur-carrier protein
MPRVEFARHLDRFFPQLAQREITVDAVTVADVVAEVDRLAPGFGLYITDERGALRPHVNIFIGDRMVVDRERLSDPVPANARVCIFQALSGG